MTDKVQLVIAQNYACFKGYCHKIQRSPQDRRMRYVHNIFALRGHNGNNSEIVIVCGGPILPNGPSNYVRWSLKAQEDWAQYNRQLKAIDALFREVRLLKDVYAVEVRHDECT